MWLRQSKALPTADALERMPISVKCCTFRCGEGRAVQRLPQVIFPKSLILGFEEVKASVTCRQEAVVNDL